MGKPGVAGRITSVFILVAVVSVITSFVLMLVITRQQFSAYIDNYNQVLVDQWKPIILDYYTQHGLTGLQDYLESGNARTGMHRNRRGMIMTMGMGRGHRLVVADSSGMVVADSQGTLIGQSANFGSLHVTSSSLAIDNQLVGTLYVISPLGPGLASLESDFVTRLTINTVILALVIGLLALISGLILGRRITSPLADLSSGIHQLANGNLGERVTPRGDQEFAELGRDFNMMAQQLEDAEKNRRRLTADIAHELRTPLALLRGQLEGLQTGGIPITSENITLVIDEVIRLSRLVKDLENLSLVESGALSLHLITFPLADLLERLTPVNIAMQDNGIYFSIEAGTEVKEIMADQDRLLQILLNLLSNSLHHVGNGGKISLSIHNRAGHLQFRVSDNGPGISPEDLPHVFDRFYRVDDSRNRREGGMGLGLAIAKGYAEAHGGTMWVESILGTGSSFCFTLPQ